MKQGILAARNMDATTRMVAAAEKLAKQFDLDADILERVQTQRGDPQVRQMQQRAAVADLLEALVEAGEKAAKAQVEPKAEPPARKKSAAKQDI